ncbi:tripartite tricarboxylate transporter TctB family protein [Spiractinospora alimapuensis]|uniref:tripartite tricarboxylate transporter TctB family protein n=1 Tax=Spiractinospora alimapuensis TaxID=2820884 RepID=UPI001F263F6B|nr:tripartite tricarboxylate transporter TctB family protein [Spiractinospora alimapuensis]QVQ54559.1 tripartite tricarboxylate transporter TctB family protein [Spiractinospora alimapuensis]
MDTPFRFSNRVMAVALGLIAIGYLVLAFQMPDFTAVQVPVQPSTLPRWLGVALLILSILLFLQKGGAGKDATASGSGAASNVADSEGTSDEGAETGTRLGRLSDPRLELALFAASAAVYIALITPLGFLLSTTLYTVLTTWYLGYRRHLVNLAVSAGVTAVLYFGMTEGLNVVLPSGPFPF